MRMVAVVLFLLITLAAVAYAAVIPGAPPVCVANSGGTVGSTGLFAIDPLISFLPNYDTLHFDVTSDFSVWVEGDVRNGQIPHLIWQNVQVGANHLPYVTASFRGTDIGSGIWSGQLRTLEIGQLTIENAAVSTEVKFLFNGSPCLIDLRNGTLAFTSQQPGFMSTGALRILSSDGSNTISRLEGINNRIDASSTELTVSPGTTLVFEHPGSASGIGYTPVDFYNPVVGDVNGGTLRIFRGRIAMNSDSFRIRNSGRLEMHGFMSSLDLRNLSIETGTVDLGNNTFLRGHNVDINGATLLIGSGAEIQAQDLRVTGSNNQLSGSEDGTSGVHTHYLTLQAGATYSQLSSQTFARELVLNNGSLVDVDSGTFRVETIDGFGGGINVDGGNLTLRGGFGPFANDATITIGPAGVMYVTPSAELELTSTIDLANRGSLELTGILSGNGSITGDGQLDVRGGGVVSPGSALRSSGPIGTLEVENSITFHGGPGNSPRFKADIDVAGGARNDRLIYHDGSVDIRGLWAIEVHPVRRLSASDLDGRSFTIIASRDSSSAGSVTYGQGAPGVVEGSAVPALINFYVSNQKTHGRDDVTLIAAKQPVPSLLTHPAMGGVTSNKAAGVHLLTHSYNNGHAAINTGLDTLLNGDDIGAHIESIHPEPYSSWLTVNLEHADQVLSAALSGEPSVDRDLWLHTSRVYGEIDGKNDLGSFDYTLDTLVIGSDVIHGEESCVGVFGGFGSASMDEHDTAIQSFSAETLHLGGYARRTWGSWQWRLAGGASYGEHDTERSVRLGLLSNTEQAEFDSFALYAGIDARHAEVQLGEWVGLVFSAHSLGARYQQDRFSESGDMFALTIDEASADSVITGIQLEGVVARDKLPCFYPTFFGRFEYDWLANAREEHEIDATMSGYPDTSHSFVGQHRGESIISAGVGLASNVRNLIVQGGFIQSWHDHGTEISGEIRGILGF